MSATRVSSGHSVQYNVRTAKQIERRMLVAVLQSLSENGFPIKSYQYTGFGSVFFVDFDLFHRQLGMTDLASVEHDESLQARCEFNKPFDCVRMQYGSVSDFIPTLDSDKKHVLWLDYDRFPDVEMFEDLKSAANQLSTGSIVLFTADIQPSEYDAPNGTPEEIHAALSEELGEFLDPTFKSSDFGLEERPRTLVSVMSAAFEEGVRTRPSAKFVPIFSFSYKDGHRMITAGGMIASDEDSRSLERSGVRDLSFTTDSIDDAPYRIIPPVLTRKERIFLDQMMPSGDMDLSKIGLDQQIAERYREVYRYLPIFAELVTT